jgi:glycosyltransferase involved in cell wall biosynthesis
LRARICVIRQGFYPFDPRLRREVSALTMAGHEVDVICLRRPDEPRLEKDGPLTVHRVSRPSRGNRRVGYAVEHAVFLVLAAAVVTRLHLRRRFDLVQANSIPDSVVFAALVPKLLGARVLLDLQECVPEFFGVKFGGGMRSPLVRLLAFIEQTAIRFADSAITCTDPMRETFEGRGAPPGRLVVVMNSAEENVFDPDRYPRVQRESGFRIICHGSLESAYDVGTVVRATALLKSEIPGIRLDIYGDGYLLEEIRALVEQLQVGAQVYLPGRFVPMEDLLKAIVAADAGVVAVPRDAFRDLTHCNKMFEFISMRKPAAVPRSRAVEAYFDDSCFQIFTAGDAGDLARALRELYENPELGKSLVRQAERVAHPYRWPVQRERYLALVQELVLDQAGQRDVRAAT